MKQLMMMVLWALPFAGMAQTKTFYIDSEKANCTGVAPMQCLRYKESPDGEWKLLYQPIEGFNFESGYAYTIRVKQRNVKNPPADGSSIRYTLKKIISKEPQMKIALPHQSVEGNYTISRMLINETLTDISAKKYTVRFDAANNRMSAKVCNTINGKFETEAGNRMKFGPMMSTRMACPDMESESAFGKLMPLVDNYSIDGNTLQLMQGSKVLMALTRQ